MDEKEFQLEKLKLKFNILKFWISTVLIGHFNLKKLKCKK